MGSQVPDRVDRIKQGTDGASAAQKKGTFTYDDSGTGAAAGLHRARQGQGHGQGVRLLACWPPPRLRPPGAPALLAIQPRQSLAHAPRTVATRRGSRARSLPPHQP